MTSKLNPQTLTQAISDWEQFKADHLMETVLAFIAQHGAPEPVQVATTEAVDLERGSGVLAVFTARAAMRKAVLWFERSREWTAAEQKEFLLVLIRELQDGIQNCNTAMYYLAGPGAVVHGNEPSLDAFLNGGGQ